MYDLATYPRRATVDAAPQYLSSNQMRPSDADERCAPARCSMRLPPYGLALQTGPERIREPERPCVRVPVRVLCARSGRRRAELERTLHGRRTARTESYPSQRDTGTSGARSGRNAGV